MAHAFAESCGTLNIFGAGYIFKKPCDDGRKEVVVLKRQRGKLNRGLVNKIQLFG